MITFQIPTTIFFKYNRTIINQCLIPGTTFVIPSLLPRTAIVTPLGPSFLETVIHVDVPIIVAIIREDTIPLKTELLYHLLILFLKIDYEILKIIKK